MKLDPLFVRKLVVAFLVGFGGVFIPAILTLLDKAASGTPTSLDKSLIISVISGGVAAGLRALLVLVPGLNLVPSDARPVLEPKDKP